MSVRRSTTLSVLLIVLIFALSVNLVARGQFLNLATAGSRTIGGTVLNQLLQLGTNADITCPGGATVNSGATNQSCVPNVLGMEFRGPVAFGNEGSVNGAFNNSGSVQTVDYIGLQYRHAITASDRQVVGDSGTLIWAPGASAPTKFTTGADRLVVIDLSSSRQVAEVNGYSSTLQSLGGDGTGSLVNGFNNFKAAAPTISDSTSVPRTVGFYSQNQGLSGVANTYGIYLDNQTGSTNAWSFYSNGGKGFHSGPFTFGSTMTGNSASSGVGYSTGAGNAVVQSTSKSTTVTLNAPTGKITLNNATLNATTTVGFTLANSSIGANDVLVVNIVSGASLNSYSITVSTVVAGGAIIELRNDSAGSLSEAVVLQFALIKGAIS